MKILGIDHICIAVNDLERARKIYEDNLNLKAVITYIAPEEKIRVVRYDIGGVALELIEPMDSESEVYKFLKSRGEGVYLISFKVENVEEAIRELKEKGIKTIDLSPRYLMGCHYAFVHPREACGVLIEILDGNFRPQEK